MRAHLRRPFRRLVPPARRVALALLAGAALAGGSAGAAQAPPAKAPLAVASDARGLAELGGYGRAADLLRGLRGRIAPDADLELTLALYEARSGDLDSAAARLWSPLLEKALADTLPLSRRHRYAWRPEAFWINGRFDGWHWYVARARAEIAARQGRWDEALANARRAASAVPLAGKEWAIVAVCAARAGNLDEARAAIERAAWLDPSLPEAHHLAGLFAWRAGARAAAQAGFRRAIALDSSYRAPAIALVRSRLPSASPDSFPAELLNGVREVALLTSPARPKEEEFVQMDTPAQTLRQVDPAVPDSLRGTFKEAHLGLGLLIDERGRVVLHDLPWFDPTLLPADLVHLTLANLSEWRFHPASRNGAPHPVWSSVELIIVP
jgi:tetratricopeptide (TPR) repeat protein